MAHGRHHRKGRREIKIVRRRVKFDRLIQLPKRKEPCKGHR